MYSAHALLGRNNGDAFSTFSEGPSRSRLRFSFEDSVQSPLNTPNENQKKERNELKVHRLWSVHMNNNNDKKNAISLECNDGNCRM